MRELAETDVFPSPLHHRRSLPPPIIASLSSCAIISCRSTGYWDDDQPGLEPEGRERVSPLIVAAATVPESRSSAPFEPDIGILLSPLRSMFCDPPIAQAWDDIMDFGNLESLG